MFKQFSYALEGARGIRLATKKGKSLPSGTYLFTKHIGLKTKDLSKKDYKTILKYWH